MAISQFQADFHSKCMVEKLPLYFRQALFDNYPSLFQFHKSSCDTFSLGLKIDNNVQVRNYGETVNFIVYADVYISFFDDSKEEFLKILNSIDVPIYDRFFTYNKHKDYNHTDMLIQLIDTATTNTINDYIPLLRLTSIHPYMWSTNDIKALRQALSMYKNGVHHFDRMVSLIERHKLERSIHESTAFKTYNEQKDSNSGFSKSL